MARCSVGNRLVVCACDNIPSAVVWGVMVDHRHLHSGSLFRPLGLIRQDAHYHPVFDPLFMSRFALTCQHLSATHSKNQMWTDVDRKMWTNTTIGLSWPTTSCLYLSTLINLPHSGNIIATADICSISTPGSRQTPQIPRTSTTLHWYLSTFLALSTNVDKCQNVDMSTFLFPPLEKGGKCGQTMWTKKRKSVDRNRGQESLRSRCESAACSRPSAALR